MFALRHARRFSAVAAKATTIDAVQKLEHDYSRLLRVVEKRIDDRKHLASKISDDMSSSEDIANLKQLKESEPLQNAWDNWIQARQLLEETAPLLHDPDSSMRSLASEEFNTLSNTLTEAVKTIFPALLIPPSTTRHLSALMELKSGVGGSESSLFLSDLLRMYQRLAHSNNWKSSIVAKNSIENGGIKDAIVEIKGETAYDTLRWESGVHRVQRVPATESSGRTHTSTVAVVVLPLMEETDAHEEELFSMDDIKLEVMRARGAGGQHVNKTESAVRLTHIPTGITVSMQDERSQHQNRRRAFQVLRSRLMDQKLTREMAERRATRRNLVRGADRSEKIRTYNYAQANHRIGLSLMNLTSVMEGDSLQVFVNAVKKHHEESIMEEMLDIEQ
ncbi:release factor [Phlegmacium glaucopus]|nr:release factor [Phlegmacium glaucopus]